MIYKIKLLLAGSFISLLTACGGGGESASGNSTPEVPTAMSQYEGTYTVNLSDITYKCRSIYESGTTISYNRHAARNNVATIKISVVDGLWYRQIPYKYNIQFVGTDTTNLAGLLNIAEASVTTNSLYFNPTKSDSGELVNFYIQNNEPSYELSAAPYIKVIMSIDSFDGTTITGVLRADYSPFHSLNSGCLYEIDFGTFTAIKQ